MEINKITTVIIFSIIGAIVVFLFIVPQYLEFQRLQLNISQKQVGLASRAAYYAKIEDTMATLESKKQAMSSIDSALPEGFLLAPVVTFLQQNASENGVEILSVLFSKNSNLSLDPAAAPSGDGQVKDTPFTLGVTGSYSGLKDFLADMDRSARIFEMETVSLTSSDTAPLKGKPAQYVLRLEARTHSY